MDIFDPVNEPDVILGGNFFTKAGVMTDFGNNQKLVNERTKMPFYNETKTEIDIKKMKKNSLQGR